VDDRGKARRDLFGIQEVRRKETLSDPEGIEFQIEDIAKKQSKAKGTKAEVSQYHPAERDRPGSLHRQALEQPEMTIA
jgi:hypothetical protein